MTMIDELGNKQSEEFERGGCSCHVDPSGEIFPCSNCTSQPDEDAAEQELKAEHAKCMPEVDMSPELKEMYGKDHFKRTMEGYTPEETALNEEVAKGMSEQKEVLSGPLHSFTAPEVKATLKTAKLPASAQNVLDDLEAKRKKNRNHPYWDGPDFEELGIDMGVSTGDSTGVSSFPPLSDEERWGILKENLKPGTIAVIEEHQKKLLKGTPKPRTKTQTAILKQCSIIKDMLISKNRKYGDSLFNPPGVFSKASTLELINSRLDDKISRLQQGDVDEADRAEDEEDIIGYLILKRVYRALEG